MPATNSACSITYRPVTPRNVGTSDRPARTMLPEVTTTTAGMRVTSDRIMNAASSPTLYRPHTVSTKPVTSRLSNPNGSNTFQDRFSSWSSRNGGYVHRIHIRKNTRANILVRNHTSEGKTCDNSARVPKNITRLSRSPSTASIKIGRTSNVWRRPVVRITAATTRQPSVTSSHIYGCRCGSVQPPKNMIVATAAIPNISPYSPSWNRANRMPVYSAKYPATSSDSASGKSNGTRLTSAVAAVRKVRLARIPNGSPTHPVAELAKRDDDPVQQGGHGDDDGGHVEDERVGVARRDVFLLQQLDGVGNGLQQPLRSNVLGAQPRLDPPADLALQIDAEHRGHNGEEREDHHGQADGFEQFDQPGHLRNLVYESVRLGRRSHPLQRALTPRIREPHE